MAGNPLASLLLLGMGVDSLSMSTGSLLRVKRVIRSFTQNEAEDLLQDVLRLDDAELVRGVLVTALERKGIGGLVRAGN